jgi:hypothetical protein
LLLLLPRGALLPAGGHGVGPHPVRRQQQQRVGGTYELHHQRAAADVFDHLALAR